MCPVDRWKWLVRRRPAPIYQKQLASPGVVRSSNATVLLDVHHITSFFFKSTIYYMGCKGSPWSSLLSLLPPSCMVVPKRDLVNIPFPFDIYNFSSPMVQNKLSMDMDMDTPRGRSTSSSANSSRELSTHSNLSSIPYHKRMEDQSNKLSWDEQVKLNEKEEFTLSYTTLKVGENKLANEAIDHTPKDGKQHSNNEVTILNNMPNLQGGGMASNNMNMCTAQGLEMSSIPYKDYQLVEPNSWDGEAYPLSIFGTNEFLEINSKNFSTSLL